MTTEAPADRRLGRIPLSKLGGAMHRVERPLPCPVCGAGSHMDVFPAAVRWPCGHTRTIQKIDPSCYKACHHNRARTLLRRAA